MSYDIPTPKISTETLVKELARTTAELETVCVQLGNCRQARTLQGQEIAKLFDELEATKAKLAESERLRALIMADLKAMETATLRYYAFASDEQIKAYADQQPNEQAKKIADLTLRLRREMAGKMEIQAALGVMIQRMKTKVPAMSEEDFGKRFG